MTREEKAIELIASLTAEGFSPYDISEIGKDFIKADGCIAILWNIQDVKDHGKEHGYPDIADEQAMEILEDVEHNHDASMGVSWETLEYYTDSYMGERGVDKVDTDEDEE
jgi:hypothetical protein